jgi:ribosomal protein S18 acetylase RimI-like enzyme
MTEDEYRAFYENSVTSYAEAKIASGNWSDAVADERARREYGELLPSGLSTPDQHFFTIRESETGAGIGALWFEVQRGTGKTKAYVNDLLIDAPHRRKGHATAAMRLLEDRARQMGCTDLALHVFAHNKEAIALYRILGMETTNLVMAKGL